MAIRSVARRRFWWGLPVEEIIARLRSMTYAEAGKRDLRLDFLRGLAVAVMVVDHIGGDTLLTQLSGGNQFIVSAAEGFIFLSGLVLGMVYGDRIRRSGPGEAALGMIQRAATLYKASVGMALAFLALALLTGIRLWVDRSAVPGDGDALRAVAGVLTLHYAFHGSDVLVMYTVLLAVAPALIYLLYRGRTSLILLGSLAVWGLYQRYPEQATVPWSIEGSAFPVAAWQLLFVFGMAAGFHRASLSRWLLSGGGSAWTAILAAATTVYLMAWSSGLYGHLALPQEWFGDATYAALFAKPTLGPGRVVAFLAVAVLAYVLAHILWLPLKALLGWFLLPLGQSSLYVYITHVFVVVLVYNLAPLLFDLVQPEAINLSAQVFGLGLLWIMVRSRFLFGLVPR